MNIDQDSVPPTANEALQMFIKALDDNEKKAFKEVDEDQICIFHHTLGQDIRNDWSMDVKNTPLTNDFKTLGITHSDDMSNILLTSAHRHFKKKPLRLQEQIHDIQEYWKKEIGKPMP